MKGKLVKQENSWYVMCIEEGDWETYYPLSEYDNNYINNYLENYYDDIHIHPAFWDGKEVEFETKTVAKLTKK